MRLTLLGGLILLMLWVVELSSGSSVSYCPHHGRMSCPICGSRLVFVRYSGTNPNTLALMKRDDFRGFLGCIRMDLHDKVVDGVNCRGKAFVKPVFEKRERSERDITVKHDFE